MKLKNLIGVLDLTTGTCLHVSADGLSKYVVSRWAISEDGSMWRLVMKGTKSRVRTSGHFENWTYRPAFWEPEDVPVHEKAGDYDSTGTTGEKL